MTANEYEDSLWGDENTLELGTYIVVMVALLCEYTKTTELYTLKRQLYGV